MNKYLMKIEFDTNDADYIYGCGIVTQRLKDMLDKSKEEYSLGGSFAEYKISKFTSFKPISEEEIKVLKKYGLHCYGEFDGFIDMFLEDPAEGIKDDECEEIYDEMYELGYMR